MFILKDKVYKLDEPLNGCTAARVLGHTAPPSQATPRLVWYVQPVRADTYGYTDVGPTWQVSRDMLVKRVD